ncbi:DNA cytosine methyltransferase [Longispora fulva]|uniref:DNA (cytosine-5-)-methyltransferase n=1 Tax=Longispora fulva TaxID=619741 RepID=A0A8J7GLW3_9ACTN|nr:DNA cytosine methyltransferase [Longispora fulva]MBG6140666.1 DNA (cytosine-5)-methyltransferase 1 [Longispora fulva]MBG6141112.1 DNA (cytosine-5)-methyltransferase 1 [Longispora fulva]
MSLFAGVGGFDLAAARAGLTPALAVEIDPAARGVLADRLPSLPLLSDVREVSARDLATAVPDPADCFLTAGWPCQDLSTAGNRAGLDGERSGLFFELLRILDGLRPGWFLLENVPGLLTSNAGRDMGTVVGSLADLGYRLAWRVLDAQGFGVPQRRRRLYFLGHRGAGDPAAVLLEPESGGGRAAPYRPPGPPTAAGPARRAGPARSDTEPVIVGPLQTSRSPRGHGTAGVNDQYVLAGHVRVAGPAAVRRLVPVEYERLQGFPDGWTATSYGNPQGDVPRFTQLGNAAPVPVAEWITRRLVAHHNSTTGRSDPPCSTAKR